MPYIALQLDDHTTYALAEAAADMAARSAFVPERRPFHITLLGSLHHYHDEHVCKALKALGPTTPPVRGQFIKWDVTKRSLRVLVQCDDVVATLERNLQARLPRGRPWTCKHITIGSIAPIAPEHHTDFLAAVEAAFPITSESVFCASFLGHENDQDERPNLPAVQLEGSEQRAEEVSKPPEPGNEAPMDGVIEYDHRGGIRHVTIQKKRANRRAAPSAAPTPTAKKHGDAGPTSVSKAQDGAKPVPRHRVWQRLGRRE